MAVSQEGAYRSGGFGRRRWRRAVDVEAEVVERTAKLLAGAASAAIGGV